MNKAIHFSSFGEILRIDMFENRLCTGSTCKMKLTLKLSIIYDPASSDRHLATPTSNNNRHQEIQTKWQTR
jgi:hypothetical protein